MGVIRVLARIDIRERLAVGVADFKTSRYLFDRPGRREFFVRSCREIIAKAAPTEADAGVQRLALSQLSDDLLVGFLGKSLERDGAQITL